MKKLILILCVGLFGCSKPEPTCVTCYVNGVEAFDACVEDYPYYDVYQIREAIDPLFTDEECHYYN